MAIVIEKLKVNYLINPICIDNSKPVIFSWQYENDFDLMQKSYRIIVSNNLSDISNNIGNCWDSGVVESSVSSGIEYEGIKLLPETKYFVKVIVETNCGKAESKLEAFETALTQEDWRDLCWIVSSLNCENSSTYIRTDFVVENKKITRARAYVACLALFEFYVNGKKADDSYLSPNITDTSKRTKYCIYDVTDKLMVGDNAAGIFMASGWTDFKRVRYIIDIFYEDGSKVRFTSNELKNWEAAGAVISSSIYMGEKYDANIAFKYRNWSTVDYTIDKRPFYMDWGWCQRVDDTLNLVMEPQVLNGMRIKEYIFPYTKQKVSFNKTLYKFDKQFSGWVRIKVKGKQNAIVNIRYAEHLNESGNIDVENLRIAKCTDTYILCGIGTEEYAPRFSYRGFCYVEIEAIGEVEILDVVGEFVKTDVDVLGSFECSNEILNKLHSNIFYTEGANQNSTLTDCNQRNERYGWLNDLCVRLYQVVNNYDMSNYFIKLIEDVTDTMDKYGAIGDTAPYYLIGGRPAEPASISYLLAAKFLYERFGNKSIIEKYYPYFEKWTDYLYDLTEDGILYFTKYGDWVPAYINDELEPRKNKYSSTGAFETEILYWYLLEMIEMGKIIDNKESVEKFKSRAQYVLDKFNEKFFKEKENTYDSGMQTVTVLPVLLGMVPNGKTKDVYEKIIEDIIKLGYHSSCGNQVYRPLFSLLHKYDDNEIIEKILTNPEYPGWGFMVKEGAISVWERWEKDVCFSNMQSYCHPMFGSYDIWFYEGLGGINTIDYNRGMQEFILKPCFNKDITFVNCQLNSINGNIVSNWKRFDNMIAYEFIIPSNTVAKLYIDGNIENLPKGITKEEGYYHCVSGNYSLVIK